MRIPDDKCLYLVEDFTGAVFFFAVIPRLLVARHQGEKVLSYIDATGFARLCCRLILPLFGWSAQRLDFSLTDIKDDAGHSVQMTISNEELAGIQRRITAGPLFQRIFAAQNDQHPDYVVFLEKQSVAFTLFDQDSCWRLMYLVRVVRWLLRQDQKDDWSCVIFARPRFGLAAVQEYAAGYHATIVPVRSLRLDVKGMLIQLVGERRLRNWYYHALRLWQRGLRPRDEKSPTALIPTGPRLLAEYYGFLNLDHPERSSDLFFLHQPAVDPQDVLLTFNLPSDPLDQGKVEELARHRVDFVALNPRARATSRVPLYLRPLRATPTETEPLFDDVARVLSEGRAQDPVSAHWLSVQTRRFVRETQYWYDFFVKHDVKIFVSWYNCESRNCVISHALSRAGGTNVLYQRSHEEPRLGSPEMTVSVDLAFGFSDLSFAMQQASRSRIPYYVITGYIGEYRFPHVRAVAADVRRRLLASGARRILAFFDENSCDDARWAPGHRCVRENYAAVLTQVLRDPGLGLVIKPKNSSTLSLRLGPVTRLLEEAVATGRCFMFARDYPPAAAALAADIAIHGHAFALTAGMESALAGVPTLLLDREGCPPQRVHEMGEGRIVFYSWEMLWQALSDHWRGPGGVPGLGDWSPIINEFDPFRDGRALERVSTYLQWMMEGYKAKKPRPAILADAAERYAQAWGRDKIRSVETCRSCSETVEKESDHDEILAGYIR